MQVLIVDMLEGFTRSGPLASPRVAALIPRQVAFLRALPPHAQVVFACDAHDPDDFEFQRFPPHCLRGTAEADICRELLSAARGAAADVHIIPKRTFSAFFDTDLDALVEAAPSRAWIVIGCVTDCCIEANVAELTYRGCTVTVIRDLIDTWDLSAATARELGLPPAHAHPADDVNRHWFDHRLPAIWGARVVDTWTALPQLRPSSTAP